MSAVWYASFDALNYIRSTNHYMG